MKLTKTEKIVRDNTNTPFEVLAEKFGGTPGTYERACDRMIAKERKAGTFPKSAFELGLLELRVGVRKLVHAKHTKAPAAYTAARALLKPSWE